MVLSKRKRKEEIAENQTRVAGAMGAHATNSAISENTMKCALIRIINSQ
jgi:hypothetical protein